VLSVDGKDEILEMEKMESGPSARIPQRARTAAVPPSTQRIVLKQTDLTEALEDVNALMRQARFRPYFRNGKPDGLLLTGVRPNSIFRKMGLRNGDIIMGVDEQDIKSVDDALMFYQNLKSSSSAKLQIKRRGRSRTMEYTIQ
jgi:general secretion pathway protein C